MKILIIDDEKPILESLTGMLKPGGYEVVSFQKPKEAIDTYKQDSFDLVITDYKMPDMNGIEVLETIKKIDPQSRIILLTGYADIENAIAAVNKGAYAFFRKPLQFDELIKTLERLEGEISGKRQKEVEMEKLVQEYENLRNKFNDLQEMLKKIVKNKRTDKNND